MSLYVGDRLVCKFWVEHSSIQTCTPDGHLHGVTYTRCRIDTIDSPDDEHMGARNMSRTKTYTKKNCASSWLFTRIRIVPWPWSTMGKRIAFELRVSHSESWWTNRERLVAWATEFYMAAHNNFSIIIAVDPPLHTRQAMYRINVTLRRFRGTNVAMGKQ